MQSVPVAGVAGLGLQVDSIPEEYSVLLVNVGASTSKQP